MHYNYPIANRRDKMTDIWEKIKASFDRVSEKALELAKEAAEKTQEQAAVAAVKIEIMKLEKNITEKLAKMGSLVHEVLKEGKDLKATEELKRLSEEITEFENKLNEFKETLEKKKREDTQKK